MTNAVVTNEQQSALEIEESTLSAVLAKLDEQLSYRRDRLQTESTRARTLTSELVNATNDEDKQMVASDEAVAHGMRDLQMKEVQQLPKLIKNPYFARLVVEEESNDGKNKEFEYRIGLLENPDCRILDWRKAPIAKLYYDYKEGDFYNEEVLGRDRTGYIKTRNLVTIRDSSLKEVQCRFGTFRKDTKGWNTVVSKGVGSETATTLQQIAAMLSPEQFKMLESNAERALVLHGVAGSGKTTLALHRLSWLLGQPERGIQAERCAILVSNAAMKEYLKEMAEGLGLSTVRIETKDSWLEKILVKLEPSYTNVADANGLVTMKRSEDRCPSTLKRIKGSSALVAAIEKAAPSSGSLYETLIAIYNKPNVLLENDTSRLMSASDITLLKSRAQKSYTNKEIDDGDEALLVLIAKKAGTAFASASSYFDHIVVDEAQDYTTAELAAIASGVEALSSLTIVGDTAQNLKADGIQSWQSLLSIWRGKEDLTNFITLSLSYRSTIEIRKYAAALRGDNVGNEEGRRGRTPIWFKTSREPRALEVAQEWIRKSLELYPNGLTAVLCATSKEARELVSQLTPTFNGMVRYADSRNLNFHAGIIVAPIDSVRGMEFSNLFIWNPSSKNFPNEDYYKNLLYIAVTRSRENVALVTYTSPSVFLPKQTSLVRIVDYTAE